VCAWLLSCVVPVQLTSPMLARTTCPSSARTTFTLASLSSVVWWVWVRVWVWVCFSGRSCCQRCYPIACVRLYSWVFCPVAAGDHGPPPLRSCPSHFSPHLNIDLTAARAVVPGVPRGQLHQQERGLGWGRGGGGFGSGCRCRCRCRCWGWLQRRRGQCWCGLQPVCSCRCQRRHRVHRCFLQVCSGYYKEVRNLLCVSPFPPFLLLFLLFRSVEQVTAVLLLRAFKSLARPHPPPPLLPWHRAPFLLSPLHIVFVPPCAERASP
jgi:hypothetical protein